jgi:hypothetical protein
MMMEGAKEQELANTAKAQRTVGRNLDLQA